MALNVLSNRRYKNPVTSIFLLSDGLDPQAKQKIPILVSSKCQELNYTINTFGFGSDHDPELMSGISKLKDGSFFFIEKLDKVDEAFVSALGGLLSVVF